MSTMTLPKRKRKPGAGRPKSIRPIRDTTLTVRVTDEFDVWLEGLVDHCRKDANWLGLTKTAVVIQALVCLAKERGYDEDPPK